MAIIIKWSDEAKNAFEKNIQYLEKKWINKEIKNFINQTADILIRLEKYPEMYSPSAKGHNVRKVAINKYIILYYRYYASKKEIKILAPGYTLIFKSTISNQNRVWFKFFCPVK